MLFKNIHSIVQTVKTDQLSSLVDDVRLLRAGGCSVLAAAVSLSEDAAASTSGLTLDTGACSRGSSFVCFLLFLCCKVD